MTILTTPTPSQFMAFLLSNCVLYEFSVLNCQSYVIISSIPELRAWLMSLHKKFHSPPLLRDDNLGICVTSGSQDGLLKAFEMLLSPGDNVIIEDQVYSGTLAIVSWLLIASSLRFNTYTFSLETA